MSRPANKNKKEQEKAKIFLESERNTFNLVLGLAVLFITLTTGIMASLFNSGKEDYGHLIIILGSGLFISLWFMFTSVKHLIESNNADDNFKKFTSERKKAIESIKWSIYVSLLFFEISLGFFALEHINYLM